MYDSRYLLYRAKTVQEIFNMYYERGNLAHCHRRVYERYILPLLGISYHTSLRCRKINTSDVKYPDHMREMLTHLDPRKGFPPVHDDWSRFRSYVERRVAPPVPVKAFPDTVFCDPAGLRLFKTTKIRFQKDRVYKFYTQGVRFGIEKSVLAMIAIGEERTVFFDSVLSSSGFLDVYMPLPSEYMYVREATEGEIERFVKCKSASLGVVVYGKSKKRILS